LCSFSACLTTLGSASWVAAGPLVVVARGSRAGTVPGAAACSVEATPGWGTAFWVRADMLCVLVLKVGVLKSVRGGGRRERDQRVGVLVGKASVDRAHHRQTAAVQASGLGEHFRACGGAAPEGNGTLISPRSEHTCAAAAAARLER